MIETRRLLLRNAISADLEHLYRLQCDDTILEYNVMQPKTKEEIAAWIDHHAADENALVIAKKETDQAIGMIYLEEDSLRYRANSICLSYYLDPAFTGQGLMQEALKSILHHCFFTRKVALVAARVFVPNVRSNRLMQRLGFTLEGTLLQAVRGYQDCLFDDNLYRMTRGEYDNRFHQE